MRIKSKLTSSGAYGLMVELVKLPKNKQVTALRYADSLACSDVIGTKYKPAITLGHIMSAVSRFRIGK